MRLSGWVARNCALNSEYALINESSPTHFGVGTAHFSLAVEWLLLQQTETMQFQVARVIQYVCAY